MDHDESVTRSLLMGLSNDGLENVLSAFQPKRFEAGSTIIQSGDSGDELFLITAGKVRIWSGDGPAVAERTLGMLGPGEHFGEASVISGGPRTATVTAVTYVETMVLSGVNYRRLVKDYPQLLENLTRSLMRRLSSMNASSAKAPEEKRGVHSLAIIVDHPCGWPLAKCLLAQMRETKECVKPILVSDTDLLLPMQQIDRDAVTVSVGELAYAIAERSHQALAVTIASGPEATAAAVRESNRVIFAVDASGGVSRGAETLLTGIPPHRRPIVAMMFNKAVGTRPDMQREQTVAIRCDYQGTDLDARFSAGAVVRLYRALVGKRVGLALGGGGARGIAHIGVLEVLDRHDVVFDSIAGTSAGAIVAAAYGAGYAPRQVRDFFLEEMVPPKLLRHRAAMRRLFLLHSFRSGRFEAKLRRYLGQMTFAQADLPLAITTLDLISGEQQIRRTGDLVTSVLQSINHPVFGRPIIHDGQMLVDGGVLMNVPASVLRCEGCDHVISVDVGSTLSPRYAKDRKGNLRVPTYLSTLLRTMDISRRHSSALHREESDLIIIPQTSEFRIEDFHAVDPLIDSGRDAGERSIEDVRRVIENLPSTAEIA